MPFHSSRISAACPAANKDAKRRDAYREMVAGLTRVRVCGVVSAVEVGVGVGKRWVHISIWRGWGMGRREGETVLLRVSGSELGDACERC